MRFAAGWRLTAAIAASVAGFGSPALAQETLPWERDQSGVATPHGDVAPNVPADVERSQLPAPQAPPPASPPSKAPEPATGAASGADVGPPADPAAVGAGSVPVTPVEPGATTTAPPPGLPPGWSASPRPGPPAGSEPTPPPAAAAAPVAPPQSSSGATAGGPAATTTKDGPAAAAATPVAPSPPAPPAPDAATAMPVAPPPESVDLVPPEKVEIKWRVDNPFRFFVDAHDTNIHRATFAALSPEERAMPILSAERALARRHPQGWAATMYRSTCWNRARNDFECADGGDYMNPGHHSVVVELTGASDAGVTCTWRITPRGEGSRRADSITKPCNEPLTVDVPYPDGAEVMAEIAGRPMARADIKVRDLLIAGMGDSFASGEGNPDLPVEFSRERTAAYGGGGKDLVGYPARIGTWKQIGDKAFIEQNARWVDQACHRSLYSFELRAALQLALEDPHRAVTYVGVACSGAEVTAGLFLRYKGNEWVPNPPVLSQISAIAQAQCGKTDAPSQDLPEAYHMQGAIRDLQGGLVLRKCAPEKSRKIDLLLVSIGGNDIGFSRLVANAVLAEKSLLKQLGGWFGEVEGQVEASRALEALDQRYKSLNRAVHNILHVPWEESDRVILAAYPPLALLGDGSATCPDGTAGMEVLSDFRLSQKRARDGTWIADKLQRVMADSAKAYGWSFAESHRKAFVGRGICAGYTDNAFSIADDLRLPRFVDDKWTPYNPADYRAYAPRQRWFRTPNDAFMTGNFHVSPSLLQKALKLESLSWFQLLLASTYSGAFHPTAEGHAAMADSVTDRAREVLKKYKQVSPEVTAEMRPSGSEAPAQFP